MISTEVQRTLVKSPPELWAELSDPVALARHLGELGEIRITRVQPEEKVEWEAQGASGTITIKPSGWGTKVTLSVTCDPAAAPAVAQTAGADAAEAQAPEPEPEPDALAGPDGIAAQPEPAYDVQPAEAAGHAPDAAEEAPAVAVVAEGALEDAEPELSAEDAVEPEPVLHGTVEDEAIQAAPALDQDHPDIADHDSHEALAYGEASGAEHLDVEPEYEPAPAQAPDEQPGEDEMFDLEHAPSSRRGFFARMLAKMRRPRVDLTDEAPASADELDEDMSGEPWRAAGEGATYAGREFGPEPPEGISDAALAHLAPALHQPEEAFEPGEPEPELAVEPELAGEPEAELVAEPEPELAAEPEPNATSEPVAASEPIAAEVEAQTAASDPIATPEPVAACEPSATPEPIATPEPVGAETTAAPGEEPGGDLGDELRAAEEAGDERVQALLSATLDRLGAAHHRPFSRA